MNLVPLIPPELYRIVDLWARKRPPTATERRLLSTTGEMTLQSHEILAREQAEEIIVIPPGDLSLSLYSVFDGLVVFQQVHGYASYSGKISGGVAFPFSAIVFPEGYIESPMTQIFDCPMRLDGFGEFACVVGQSRYELSVVYCDGFSLMGFRLGHPYYIEALPFVLRYEPIDFIDSPASSYFHSSVAAVYFFMVVIENPGKVNVV